MTGTPAAGGCPTATCSRSVYIADSVDRHDDLASRSISGRHPARRLLLPDGGDRHPHAMNGMIDVFKVTG